MDDRSIKIPVEIDDKQAQKELNKLEGQINKAREALERKTAKRDGLTASLNEATKKADELKAKLDDLNTARSSAKARRDSIGDELSEAQAASDNAKSHVEKLATEIERARENAKQAARQLGLMEELAGKDPMAAQTATQRVAIADARAGLEAQRQKVEELNSEYDRLVAKQEQERGVIQSATAETESLKAELTTVATDESFAEPVKALEGELKTATAEVERRQKAEAKANDDVKEETANLARLTGQYDQINMQLAQQGSQAWPQVRHAAQGAITGVSSGLNKGLKTMLKYGLGIRSVYVLFRRLRSVLTDGIKEFAVYDAETRANIDNLRSALATLKGSFVSAVAPIFNAVAPAIQYFIDLITAAANAVGVFFAVLGGKSTYQRAVSGLNAVGDAASSAGSAAAEAQKQFSGLDELNVWQNDASSGGGGGGGGGGSSGLSWEEEEIDPSSNAAKVAEYIKANLEAVKLLIDEFGFVIGVILLFSGHPALGLGMMLFFGYQGIKEVATNWDALKEQLGGAFNVILSLIATAMMAIGAILVFGVGPSNPKLFAIGLGLLIAGLEAEAGVIVTANWDAISEYLQGSIGSVVAIVGAALLAIGALLVFGVGPRNPKVFAIGLGMLVAGIGSETAVVVANWDSIVEAMRGKVGEIVAIVSAALIAIGAILMFVSPTTMPIGLGMVAAGVAGEAAVVSVNWDTIVSELSGATGKVVAIVGGALIAIGLILTFVSPATMPIGLGLLAAGLATEAAVVSVNWDSIRPVLETAVNGLVGVLSAAALVVGSVLAFSGAAIPLGIAMMAVGAAGLATVTALNWNAIKTALQGPLGTAVAITSSVLLVLGIILAFSGVGLPLGIGLILLGAAGLATTAVANWGTIKEKIQGALDGVKTAWETWKKNHPVIAGILDTIFGAVATAVGAAKDLVVNFIGKVGEGWNKITEAWDGIKNSEAVKTIKGAATTAWTDTKTAWEAVKDEPSLKTIKGAIQTTGKAAWSVITTAWDAVKNSSVVKTIGGKLQTTGAHIWSTMKSAWNSVKSSSVVKTIGGALKTAGGNLWNTMKGAWDSVKSGTVFKTIAGKTGVTWNNIKEKWNNFKSTVIYKTIAGVVGATWNRIKEKWNSVKSTVIYKTIAGVVGATWNRIKDKWDEIKSSSVWKTAYGIVSQSLQNLIDIWNWLTGTKTVTFEAHAHTSGTFAKGGALYNGLWHKIPQYASGTASAHGSLFLAGEAGPEVVGHVGGRTEVLNKSQLAAVMYSAIVAGMARPFSALAGIVNAARESIEQVQTSVEHIAYLLSGSQLAVNGPAMASGTIIPPQILRMGDDLSGIRAAVEELSDKLDSLRNGGSGDINVSAQVRERTLFEITIAQGRLAKAQTGKNPFDF